MGSTTARREAVARLGQIAGYDDRLDIDLTLARGAPVQVLIRQALKAAIGDPLMLEEVRVLAPIAGGQAWVLDDLQSGPLAAEGEPMTLDELGKLLAELNM